MQNQRKKRHLIPPKGIAQGCATISRSNYALKREKMAEEEGFEPPVPCGTHDFESRAFNHSAIPPKSQKSAKGREVKDFPRAEQALLLQK
jgi:hypothetical protein